MTRIAFVFPGQGSQSVGMGKSLAQTEPSVMEAYEGLNQALGFELSRLCFEGPETELLKTEFTQPAIVATSSLLALEAMRRGLKAEAVAGHSVGEYSALVSCGVLSLEDATKLVHLRGRLMDEACPQGTGSMAALIGLDEEKTREYLKALELEEGQVLDVAGLNCPGQTVIAGHLEALKKAIAGVRAAGGRMGIELNVSGPFHSRLMQPAEAGLARKLAETDFGAAQVPVYSNTTAMPTRDAKTIQECLMQQLTLPVLWEKSIQNMLENGVDTFVEFGAGNVLAGMIRKIDRKAKIFGVHDTDSLNQVMGELSA